VSIPSITIADVISEDRSKYPSLVFPSSGIVTLGWMSEDWSSAKVHAVFTVGECPYGWVVTKRKIEYPSDPLCTHHHYASDYSRKRALRRRRMKMTETLLHRFRLEEGIGGRLIIPSELVVNHGSLLPTAHGRCYLAMKRARRLIVEDYPYLPHHQ
jgi:hypothetical protein